MDNVFHGATVLHNFQSVPYSCIFQPGTIGGGDAAGGSDANTGAAADSYSSNYFGRELPELSQVPLPAGGSSQSGRRKHQFKTGAVYNGEWLGKERHGFGMQSWPDGAIYQGEWSNNTATGKGRFRHSD